MKIAMAQMGNAGSVEKNLEKSIHFIALAAKQGCDLILFPEVQMTEFFPQHPGQDVRHYAVKPDSGLIRELCAACRDNHIMAVPNVYLEENGKYYDVSILIGSDGEILGKQKMVHIAYAEKFYETDYYSPSDDGFHVFETEFGNIGIVACFDRHYPESIRTEALLGADLILIPTVNTTDEPMELFEQEIRVQAFHNSVYAAMANRVGKEDEMEFAGESIVVSPEGETVFKADHREQLAVVEIENIRHASEVRSRKPYTSLRRKEFYQ